MLTEYRQRFSQFQSALAREEYRFFSGQQAQPDTAHLWSENSDLMTPTVIAELRQALADLSESRETERAAVQRLIAFAIESRLNASVRDLNAEIARAKSRATIRWQDDTISFHDAWHRLPGEADRQHRRELLSRLGEAIKSTQDLRAERLEKLHDAARASGFENYLTLHRDLCGIAYDQLAAQASALLAATESRYVTALAFILPRDAGVSLESATRADIGYLSRLSRFDEQFPAWRRREVYAETFRGLGIRTWQQANITIDDAPRPHKHSRPFCALVRIPDDIRLSLKPGQGWHDYARLFSAAGRAQQFAWTSRNLLPEFQRIGDGAVTETWATLFQLLLHDEKWLSSSLGFADSREFRHTLAIHRLRRVRRAAARLIYEVELHSDKLTGSAGARYAELLSDAVRVKYDETEHLRDLSDGFQPADCLRAWAFEAQLREYLKSKFGSRWWASRRAGEMLIDLWNTGLRYSADQLAAMIGLGELSVDWLAAELMEQVQFKP